MASIRTKFSVGLFVIVGVGVAVVAVIWLGMSGYLEKGRYFAAYFDESVQGLDKDSPVKYRGVSIGRVQSVKVAPDENLIEVIMKIESGIDPEKNVADIVARLKSVGITGLMFIELERKQPGTPDRTPNLGFTSQFPVISTRPSDISQLFQGIEDVLKMFGQLDLKNLSDKAVHTLSKLDDAVEDARIDQLAMDLHMLVEKTQKMMNSKKWIHTLDSIDTAAVRFRTFSANADGALVEIKGAASKIDGTIDENKEKIGASFDEIALAAKNISQVVDNSAKLIDGADHHLYTTARQAVITLKALEDTTVRLNRLIEQVSNQPSQLLFSKPAAPKIKHPVSD